MLDMTADHGHAAGDGKIGDATRRKEDQRLVTGHGTYADDITFPGLAYAFMLRSPHAHARIRAIDAAPARAAPGVLLVMTGADVTAAGLNPIPHATGSSRVGYDVKLINNDGSERLVSGHELLATDVARFAGEPVAIVVAETLAQAKDASELIEVDYEVLPSVTTTPSAVAATAPVLWPSIPGNVALDAQVGDREATEKAFAAAAHRVCLKTWVQRVTGVHMEPRAAIASYDAASGRYTLHASEGLGPVRMREELATILGVPLESARAVAPADVGGNFGTRNAFYPEWGLMAHAARMLGRPVKHVAERQEAFLSDYQARDLYVEAELALDAKGKFIGLRSSNVSNVGAHTVSFVALNKGCNLMTGVYAIPAAHVRARAAVSNTPSTIPYRSAGRPEAMFVIERLVDLAARQCGFDRVALRRKNLIPAKAMPYRNPVGIVYDSGDYAATMQTALKLADWDGFPKRRREARKRGRLRGIGLANYVEAASGVPREWTHIIVHPEGRVTLMIGTQSTGQGHETTFSQLAADWLGVPFDKVDVKFGDTDFVKGGGGSHSGRSLRFGSIVIHAATNEIIARGKEIAAALLETAAADIEFADGRYFVTGTDRGVSLFDVATAARDRADLPEHLRGPLAAVSDKLIGGLAFPYGSHVCEVEVDPDTGSVEVVHHVGVDDVGRAVNPLVLHGQAHGGIAQGLGQALLEHCHYDDENGQMLSASFMDYAMPRASDLPSFVTELSEVPSTAHPLGFRPGGEGGTTPALAVAVNAIVDALSEFGVTHLEMPVTPQRIWQAIRDGRARGNGDQERTG